jgi:phage terminase small subunit
MSKKTAETAFKPPAYLKPATRDWFAHVMSEYSLEQHHYRLLVLAGESWDRGQQARQAIEKHGITYVDRFGAPRKRPEIAVEAESRIAFARILRELDLDVDPPATASRPPALNSNRRNS